jgi:hypothetical protein
MCVALHMAYGAHSQAGLSSRRGVESSHTEKWQAEVRYILRVQTGYTAVRACTPVHRARVGADQSQIPCGYLQPPAEGIRYLTRVVTMLLEAGADPLRADTGTYVCTLSVTHPSGRRCLAVRIAVA